MHEPLSKTSALFPFNTYQFANGSYAVRRSAHDIEVWGANLSEHYTIHINNLDEGSVDVIYLGIPQALPL